MTTYVGKFFPNLSDHTAVLRALCKQGVIWPWTQQHTIAFEHLKTLLTTTPALQYYDPHDTVTLSVDASHKGLGALLSQSKGSYIYGHKVLVETDHKPLEAIFSKPLNRCLLRLQCMQIKLQNYDIMLRYVPGKELVKPDALLRASDPDIKFELQEQEIATQQGLVVHHIHTSQNTLAELHLETQNDETLNHLKTIIMNGWPNSRQQVPACVKPYNSFRDELTIHNELVYKGTQIVVPKSMSCTILSEIHYNHMGIQKSKLWAREYVFWPGMSKDIQDMVDNCITRRAAKNQNSKEPQINTEIPDRPWQIVAADIFHFQGKDYLLMVDAYSKYPKFSHLTNLSLTQLGKH
ncbi:hypothetical protein PR048_013673 [Dryococelus australis]|uniref:RNA-directed DNA polymerase n=1 Tax=Dryococelus australis TaxID=614101 RepID=A0ABQ9HSV1_9NEOP|nr:hypothetical protein PR048_013673 [Dryococelus australis]